MGIRQVTLPDSVGQIDAMHLYRMECVTGTGVTARITAIRRLPASVRLTGRRSSSDLSPVKIIR